MVRMLRSRVDMLRPRIGFGGEKAWSRDRERRQHGRRWYHSARWKKLRMDVLVRDLFTCQECGKIEVDTSQLVADHIEAHRGDERLFWNEANLRCLCASCHNSTKQKLDRRSAIS